MQHYRFIIAGVTTDGLPTEDLDDLQFMPGEAFSSGSRIIYDGHNIVFLGEGARSHLNAYVESLNNEMCLRAISVLHKSPIEKIELSGRAISRLDTRSTDTLDQSYLGRLVRDISKDNDAVNIDTLLAILNRFMINAS
jgi:hypothetical protein